MDHFVVSSRDGFAAAILAAAQPTFEDANALVQIADAISDLACAVREHTENLS